MLNPYFLYTEDVNISKFFEQKDWAEAEFEVLRKDYEDRGYEVNPISDDDWSKTFEPLGDGWTMYFVASKEVINPNHQAEDLEDLAD